MTQKQLDAIQKIKDRKAAVVNKHANQYSDLHNNHHNYLDRINREHEEKVKQLVQTNLSNVEKLNVEIKEALKDCDHKHPDGASAFGPGFMFGICTICGTVSID